MREALMEFVFINDWTIWSFAFMAQLIMAAFTVFIISGAVFVATVVYDIIRQVAAKKY